MHSGLDCQFGKTYNILTREKLDKFRDDWFKDLQIVIIDEMSMISCSSLYDVHRRMIEIFGGSKKFAGKAVILLGDLMQLKPVRGSPIFSKPRDKKRFSIWSIPEGNLWNNMTVITLTSNFRQGNNNEWNSLLKTVRCLKSLDDLPSDQKDLLESRRIKNKGVWIKKDNVVHTFYTNAEVEKHNKTKLNQLKTELVKHKANVVSAGGYKYSVSEFGAIDNSNFLEVLKLKIGARVMLIFNINTEDSLVNGATGTVLDIIKEEGPDKIKVVIVQFDDPNVGVLHRKERFHICEKYAAENGTPIEIARRKYRPESKSMKKHGLECTIYQFPLRLAWASTAHKLQGVTIKPDQHLVCHGHKHMPKGMGYVMLSRCSTIESIHLAKDFELEKALKSDPVSLAEKERLDKLSILNDFETEVFDIFYINCRSLQNKMDQLQNDPYAMRSKYIALAETWFEANENKHLPGYRFQGASVGRGKGCALFEKDSESSTLWSKTTEELFQMITIELTGKKTQLTLLYISQGCQLSSVVQALRKVMCSDLHQILIGDFNFEESENNALSNYLKSKNLHQHIKRPTHKAGRGLDHLYTDQEKLISELQIFGVHYSDHACFCIKLKE